MAGGCVRVTPPQVEFTDVVVGQVYRAAVTAANVGKTMKKIVVEKPACKWFKFTASSSAELVAPGLSVSGLVEFTPEEDEEVRGCLLFHVDDTETIEVPLLGFPRACSLIMDSVLDFGCIAASSQLISKHHHITNQGSAPGVFHVQYKGDPSVTLSPRSGVVAAGATQWLKVELRTDQPRIIDVKALVKLQNRSAVVLSIRAEVVDQRLEVFDPLGDPLSCLWFGPVYFGTSCVENVVLRNNSPEPCDWVCVLQDTAAGTELGTNLQKSTDAALLGRKRQCGPADRDASQILECAPNQGRLGPHDKTTVAVRFSPTRKSSSEGRRRSCSADRQDYCLFLLFESIESKQGFTHHNGNSGVELAVTGSGLPVSLAPSPSERFHFAACVTGQRVDRLCVLQNLCPQLPVAFRFRKLAHFAAEPPSGTIPPGQRQDVVLSFAARQQGTFQVCQKLDVLGHVLQKADKTAEGAPELELHSIHTLNLHLFAICHSETLHPAPKLNPGITPAANNPTGPRPHVRSSELALCRGMADAAVLCADKTQLHAHRGGRRQKAGEEEEEEEEEFIAFPNDRAASIRPASAHRQYRTIFTGVHRYRYVDPDYAFTEEEEKQRQRHRRVYADFIGQLRQTRLQKTKERQHEKAENAVDIGIVPSEGLVPPALRAGDLGSNPNYGRVPVATKNTTSTTQEVSEAVNTVPTTRQEVADCNRTLTPQELYQVDIGPSLADLGEVCLQSACVRRLELINRLAAFVWVQLEVDCPELQGSSPLSHVLPPHSHHSLPLTFQSSKLGPFFRPVSYSVNRQHRGQIVVRAQVVPPALELSSTRLVLRPAPSLLARSGYRSSVTLRNRREHAAEFTWRPVVTERGILFSVRPATGTVEPLGELDCEVVWHAAFSSPAKGDFDLCVHEGNTQRLHCIAKVGPARVQLAEEQVRFGSVPLNMASVRTAVLHNAGRNHAYYQVLDVCPLPGMLVSPPEGVVPSGGQAALRIHFSPESVIKFDTRVEIALRNMKPIELRVGGSVEPPQLDMSVSRFQFHGVHAGSRRSIPFTLTNKSAAAARVTFDLSGYADFSVQPCQPSAKNEPGVGVVEVQGDQSVDCSLVFSPTQAASYDFDLPLTVNGVRWPAASPSPLPPPSSPSSSPTPSSTTTTTTASSSSSSSLSAVSRKHFVRPLPGAVAMVTPRSQHIQATALCAPLEMSPSSLHFDVEPLAARPDAYVKTVELKAAREDSVFWRCGATEHVHWRLDGDAVPAPPTADRKEGRLCAASPSSGRLGPGQSICLVVRLSPEAARTGSKRVTHLALPLYLGHKEGAGTGGEERQQPYRELSVTVTLRRPRIVTRPPRLLFTPVPLGSSATATLTLLALEYVSGTEVSADVEEVELPDGTKIKPVSVVFPEGNTFPAQSHDQKHPPPIHGESVASLTCSVSFHSAVPLSLCTAITFTDHLHNRFKVKLCAVADNCLLSVWPYLALHQSDQQIVLRTGATAVEAILQRYHTPSLASCPLSSSSSSSFDHNSSTNKNSASDSFPDSDSGSGQASRTTDISPNGDTPTNPGVPEFPTSDSAEGLYYHNVLLAVERWFSLFGWPGGPHPISIPHTLRRVVSKIQTNGSSGRNYRVSQNKDSRSVVDMLRHLTGRQIPGIPRCQTLPADVDQRADQLLQQHGAMLAFLRAQGACLCHIRPEYLLDLQEFKHWSSLQSKEEDLDYSSVDYESLSKRSWTDVLLQIYKVLVLCRLPESGPTGILPAGSRPLASNIYSSRELQLLAWLNGHYEDTREAVWGSGGAPSARWIVNFDLDLTDGLVLAALLAAHCPYLIRSHFRRMYSQSSSLEQILHNNIIVVQALTALCLNLDVQPTDLSDPNPVQMLMLCAHLYERLPQYLPLKTITLSGGLHGTFSKQVRLKNTSSKPVKYQAFLLGDDAHLFFLPDGSTVTVPSNAGADLAVAFSCSSVQPAEAALLLVSARPHGAALAFALRTHVSHITPTDSVECTSPCYQLKAIQVPVTNPFSAEATFRVALAESPFNPLEPEKKRGSLGPCMTNLKASGEEGKSSDHDGESGEFLSAARSVRLKPGQSDTLSVHFLPFCPGTKYCSVLLVCPQVGDMVYIIKATAELPLPSPLGGITTDPDAPVCVPALALRCRVGRVREEVLRVPLINMAREQALAVWGRHCMSADERRRRALTHTLHSSSVRTSAAASKLQEEKTKLLSEGVEYSVEASLPEQFVLPSTVKIPIKEDANIPWESPTDCGCVDIPFRFQADRVGEYTCQVVLSSWCDTRVHVIEVLVTSQEESVHLSFYSPAHQAVTQVIPLHNETRRDWKMLAEVRGEGFSGPEVLNVPAGTKASYPLTFQPSSRGVVMGELSLHNDCDGVEHVFALRGEAGPPPPADHVLLHCPVGRTTHTQLDVPNHSRDKLTLKVVTDLSVVSGAPSVEIQPGRSATYALAASPWKRGRLTGRVSFREVGERKGSALEPYEVHFSLELVCEPAEPVQVLEVQCCAQSSLAIEIPVRNPRGDPLTLDVSLEGDDLSGAGRVSVPPRETLAYTATFSPRGVGKSTGGVFFQSELAGEFWYRLELYALPPPVSALPQTCCQLGKWTRQTVPVVNPTSEAMELSVANSNPRNYRLETDSGNTLVAAPRSCAELGVRFRPSSVGDHAAVITFTRSEMQEWCVLLSGRGVRPASQEPVAVSAPVGSRASVAIPFTNPTQGPVQLHATLTGEDPGEDPIEALSCLQAPTDFSVSLIPTEGLQVGEGGSVDVPVVFAPNSAEPQKAWLRLAMNPLGGLDRDATPRANNTRSESACWIYPLRGIPTATPAEGSPFSTLCVEAGRRLEREADVQLTGCVPGSRDGKEVSPATAEDFLCDVRFGAESEPGDGLSVSVRAARRDPDTGVVTLTLNVVFAPSRPCRCSALLAVRCVSGGAWEFPVALVAAEPRVDDVIRVEAAGLGRTSAVGFRLTSTIRRSVAFKAWFLAGSGGGFAVTPTSGTLPPAGSAGALVTVAFTPAAYGEPAATLAIQAADMRWTYEVRGKTRPPRTRNLRLPANSAKISR